MRLDVFRLRRQVVEMIGASSNAIRLRGRAVLSHGSEVGLAEVLGLTHLAVLLRY